MTHPQLWRRIASGATLAVLAAACSGTTATKLIDPAGTAAAVSAADSALPSPVVTSFSTIGAKLTPVAAIFGPASLYSATKPDLGARQPFALTLERAAQLQALVPQLSNLTGVGIPKIDSIAGAVFQWDATNHRYYKTMTTGGTSLNGPCIRFILYAIDPLTNEPAPRLTPVGTAAFIDRTGPTPTPLDILVLGSGGAPTYVAYTVAVTPGTKSFTASPTR